MSEWDKLIQAHGRARAALLAEQSPQGHWVGKLSSSALATATAVSALSLVDRGHALVDAGLDWLAARQNADGGWGDTPDSQSNLSTTLLGIAAHQLARRDDDCFRKADAYATRHAGDTLDARANALRTIYGRDRTFAAPILTNCALAAEADGDAAAWRLPPSLPFELACCPRAWFRWLRLQVVSYALPALIAIGQLIHQRRPAANPLLRALRRAVTGHTLRLLEAIQPQSGGFLEAVPLTSFVTMSLAATGRADHAVARRGVEFIERTARSDGSWPIDVDLCNWLTSLSAAALTAGGQPAPELEPTRQWLLDHQHTALHPYTGSPPGGWAWTDLSGGVPDADDTAGALVALARLDARPTPAIADGLRWLLNIQNSDGGWPTFCRGWGRLPFDRSAADLTAHALRAIAAWRQVVGAQRVDRALARGRAYLRSTQRADGAWLPLWFGNQHADAQQNPVYGTARVLAACSELGWADATDARRGVAYLVAAQNLDHGWGGDRGAPSSVEETALAVDALAGWPHDPSAARACLAGARWLAEHLPLADLPAPSPIGLYFAKLWYSERLYPIIFTVAALGRVLAGFGISSPKQGRGAEMPKETWLPAYGANRPNRDDIDQ